MQKLVSETVVIYHSHELNIGIPATRSSISFTFNLEAMTRNEIEEFMKRLNTEFQFKNITQVPSHPLDISLVALANIDDEKEKQLDEFLKGFKWSQVNE